MNRNLITSNKTGQRLNLYHNFFSDGLLCHCCFILYRFTGFVCTFLCVWCYKNISKTDFSLKQKGFKFLPFEHLKSLSASVGSSHRGRGGRGPSSQTAAPVSGFFMLFHFRGRLGFLLWHRSALADQQNFADPFLIWDQSTAQIRTFISSFHLLKLR